MPSTVGRWLCPVYLETQSNTLQAGIGWRSPSYLLKQLPFKLFTRMYELSLFQCSNSRKVFRRRAGTSPCLRASTCSVRVFVRSHTIHVSFHIPSCSRPPPPPLGLFAFPSTAAKPAVLGALWIAPVVHYWFDALDATIKEKKQVAGEPAPSFATKMLRALKMVTLDQTIGAPIVNAG